MSVRVIAMVFEAGPQDLAQHSVMMALADNAGDSGEAWPGVELLARKSRLSERHVLRVLAELEASGWLTVRRRVMVRRGCDRVCGNLYQFNLARLAAEAGAARREPDGIDSAAGRRRLGTAKSGPAERGARHSGTAHDTVSPAMTQSRVNSGQPERAHDTVSPAAKTVPEQVTSAPEQVTLEAGAGDMALADLLLNQRHAFCNRQEPSIEPPIPLKPPKGGHCMQPRPRRGETQEADAGEGDRLGVDGDGRGGDADGPGVDSDGLTVEQREELAEINAIRGRMQPRAMGPLSPEQFLEMASCWAAREPTRGTAPPGGGGRRRRERRWRGGRQAGGSP